MNYSQIFKNGLKKNMMLSSKSLSHIIGDFFKVGTIVSRDKVELLLTALAALVFVRFYNSSPVSITISATGMAIAIPILLKKPEYAVLFLAAILPFRDIHIISIIHFKRLIIWSLFIYFLIRQFTISQHFIARNIALFTKIVALFVLAIIVSFLKTASELHTTTYITIIMLKSTILSDALAVLEGILIVYIIYHSMGTFRQIQTLISIIIEVSAIIALLGILQYYIGGPPGIIGFLFDQEYQFYGRATSVFSNPNMFGGFLAPMIGIAFVSFVWGTMDNRKRIFFVLPALILNSFALLLSFSRGAMLQVFFSMIVIGYVYYTKVSNKKLSWKLILVTTITLGLIFSAIQFYDFYMRARLSTYKGNDYLAALQWIKTTSDFHRKNSALKALQTFAKHPILGIGYNVFHGKAIAGFEYFGISVHNQFLKILVEMGLLGFVPFIILLSIVVRTGLKIWDKHQKSQVRQDIQVMMLLLLSGFSTTVFGYLFADPLAMFAITGYLWIFSGAIFALDRQLMRDT